MSILNKLNKEQQEAAKIITGPSLILAGAGSGKTRTITYKIAYMVNECDINPRNILALTFTNKAAKEMKERIIDLINDNADNMVISTFHSFAVRLLKMYGEKIGYTRNFNIYDTDDQKAIIKSIIKEQNIDTEIFNPNELYNIINKNKEKGVELHNFEKHFDLSFSNNKIIYNVFKRYIEILRNNNAMDFTDLLLNTNKLLKDKYVLDKVQDKYQYIIVDEYQDTNNIQYEIIHKIAKKTRNICVVGDENQSIYAFRGANMQNILDFEKDYHDAKTFKLERNYRSTQRILNAANEVIKNNSTSRGKNLFTEADKGEKIKIYEANSSIDEADFVANQIKIKNIINTDYGNITILYRNNFQSRALEERLRFHKIPYKIFGGIQFYQRKEIKDIMYYLQFINNTDDNYIFSKIINTPKRGVGLKSLEKLEELATTNNISLFEAISHTDDISISTSIKYKLYDFKKSISDILDDVDNIPISAIIKEILDKTDYIKSLEKTENPEERANNIEELINSIVELEKKEDFISLAEYLENISLASPIDDMNDDDNVVKLMTIHGSKGLEFESIFIVGMEEGIFPGINIEENEIEEERRLAYVAITRAMKYLTISYAKERLKWGISHYNIRPSRFISEMNQVELNYLNRNIIKPKEEEKKYTSVENFNPFKNKNNSIYQINDIVEHIKWGKGIVVNVDEKYLDVDFSNETKKIMLVLAEKFLVKK